MADESTVPVQIVLQVSGDQTAAEKLARANRQVVALDASATGATRQFRGLTGAVSSAAGSFASFATRLAAIATGFLTVRTALSQFSTAMRVASDLGIMARSTGLSTAAIAALRYEMVGLGLDADSASQMILRMTRAIGDAITEAGPAREAIERLGLSVDELAAETAEEQFIAVRNALAALPSSAQRAAFAVKLFGREALQLLPILSQSAEGIGRLTAAGEAMSRAAPAALELRVAFERLKGAVLSFWAPIIEAVAPTLTSAILSASRLGFARAGGAVAEFVIAFKHAFKEGRTAEFIALVFEAGAEQGVEAMRRVLGASWAEILEDAQRTIEKIALAMIRAPMRLFEPIMAWNAALAQTAIDYVASRIEIIVATVKRAFAELFNWQAKAWNTLGAAEMDLLFAPVEKFGPYLMAVVETVLDKAEAGIRHLLDLLRRGLASVVNFLVTQWNKLSPLVRVLNIAALGPTGAAIPVPTLKPVEVKVEAETAPLKTFESRLLETSAVVKSSTDHIREQLRSTFEVTPTEVPPLPELKPVSWKENLDAALQAARQTVNETLLGLDLIQAGLGIGVTESANSATTATQRLRAELEAARKETEKTRQTDKQPQITTAPVENIELTLQKQKVEYQRESARIEERLARASADWRMDAVRKWEAQSAAIREQQTLTRGYIDQLTRMRESERITTNERMKLDEELVQAQQHLARYQIAELQLGPDPESYTDQFRAVMVEIANEWGTWAKQLAQSFKGVFETSISAISDGISGLILRTKTWGQALLEIGRTILSSIVGAIVQMGVRWVATQIVMAVAGRSAVAAATAATAPMAAASAAMWATPAYLASVATFGGAAGAGLAALQAGQTTAMTTSLAAVASGGAAGFQRGGYTGEGPETEPAGIVHRGEYVLDAKTVKRIGVETLERVKKGQFRILTINDEITTWPANVRAAGFQRGGYTGEGPETEPAGIVHRGEYVLDAKTVKRIGVETLESVKKGQFRILTINDEITTWPANVRAAGFQRGGYTGEGPETEPAGIAHRGEYVLDAKTVKRIGVETLERVKKGQLGLQTLDAVLSWPQSAVPAHPRAHAPRFAADSAIRPGLNPALGRSLSAATGSSMLGSPVRSISQTFLAEQVASAQVSAPLSPIVTSGLQASPAIANPATLAESVEFVAPGRSGFNLSLPQIAPVAGAVSTAPAAKGETAPEVHVALYNSRAAALEALRTTKGRRLLVDLFREHVTEILGM